MATTFRREIDRNRRHAFLLGSWDSHSTTDGSMEKRMGALTAQKSCLHRIKNLVNFGSVTPEFAVMVWRPFVRQMGEIGETRYRFLGLVFDNGWQEPLNGFAPNLHGRRVWSFARTTLNVKLKSQRSRPPYRDQNVLCTHNSDNTPAVWTGWNALVADNVAQAANATSRLLQRVSKSSPQCVRWAWRATAGLGHAFLVSERLKHQFTEECNGRSRRIGHKEEQLVKVI